MEGIPHSSDDDDKNHQVLVLPPVQFWAIIASLFLIVFLAGLDNTIVSTCLPKMAEEFGALDKLSWVIVSYMLSSTACSPLYGKFSDIFGRKYTVLFCVGVFFISSLLCAVATSMIQLIIFRGIQGVGGGGIFGMMWVIIGDIVPMEKRPAFTGVIATSFTLASVVGPLLGGVFTDTLTWRWSFWINLPISGVALVVIWKFLNIPRDRVKHSIDYLGTLTIMAGVICLCLACTWGGSDYEWNSGTIIGLLIAGGVLIILFVVVELKAPEPVLPMTLFKTRNFTASAIVGFFLGVCMLTAFIYLPIYWQTVMGYTALDSGITMLANALLVPFGAGLASGLIMKTKSFVPFAFIGLAITVIAQYLYSTIHPDISRANQVGYLIVGGIGVGIVVQVPMISVQNSIEKKNLAVASTATQFFQSMGGVLGAAIFNSVINNVMKTNMADVLRKVQAMIMDMIAAGHPPPQQSSADFSDITSIPEPVRTWVREAYGDAINKAFFTCIWFALTGFVCCLLYKHVPLRQDEKKTDEVKDAELGEVKTTAEETPVEVIAPEVPIAVVTVPAQEEIKTEEDISVPESAVAEEHNEVAVIEPSEPQQNTAEVVETITQENETTEVQEQS